MTLQHLTVGPLAVLSVSGEVDLATVPRLRNALVRLVVDNPGQLVAVDLDGVQMLDDTGLGLLLGSAGRAREHGGDLAVVCRDPRLLERFRLSRLDQAVEVAASVHDLARRAG